MVDEIMASAQENMDKTIESLEYSFSTVRTGRANALVLNGIMVDYYGVMTPINQMAAVKTPDAHMLVVEPWDKGSLRGIEKAILESDLGVTPSNDGSCIRLPFPALTEERRRDLVKQCKGYVEEARISIRNARRDANSAIQKLDKDGEISEDDARRAEDSIQKLTNKYIDKTEEAFKNKEAEVMEI